MPWQSFVQDPVYIPKNFLVYCTPFSSRTCHVYSQLLNQLEYPCVALYSVMSQVSVCVCMALYICICTFCIPCTNIHMNLLSRFCLWNYHVPLHLAKRYLHACALIHSPIVLNGQWSEALCWQLAISTHHILHGHFLQERIHVPYFWQSACQVQLGHYCFQEAYYSEAFCGEWVTPLVVVNVPLRTVSFTLMALVFSQHSSKRIFLTFSQHGRTPL